MIIFLHLKTTPSMRLAQLLRVQASLQVLLLSDCAVIIAGMCLRWCTVFLIFRIRKKNNNNHVYRIPHNTSRNDSGWKPLSNKYEKYILFSFLPHLSLVTILSLSSILSLSWLSSWLWKGHS